MTSTSPNKVRSATDPPPGPPSPRVLLQRCQALVLCLVLAAAPSFVSAQDTAITGARAEEIFAQIDPMLTSLGDIMGLELLKPIQRALLRRDQINRLVQKRLREGIKAEEVRRDELFLKKFGLVGEDFGLLEELTDVLTEQATALYDYKTRKMYVATWTPEDLQEFALVHELAHALADQHFNLRKFVKQANNGDEDMALSAVLEGQASWAMTEYVLRPTGRSLVSNRFLAVAAVAASRVESKDYPAYSSAPLYLRESLLFPYTDGLLFQQAVVEKLGQDAFEAVFRNPPISTQQILHPEVYFEGRVPVEPALPEPGRLRGFKEIAGGQVGEFDHQILLKQYLGEDEAKKLAPAWRGGRYRLRENKKQSQVVLLYASQWADEERAGEFLDAYLEVCKKKWSRFEIEHQTATEVRGRGGDGYFVIVQQGPTVKSMEGLPQPI